MTPEERELLKKSIELSEESNKILRSMRRATRWNNVFRVIYWIVILGAAFGAYYFIQPYVSAVTDAYTGIKSDINSVKDATSKVPNTIADFLDFLK